VIPRPSRQVRLLTITGGVGGLVIRGSLRSGPPSSLQALLSVPNESTQAQEGQDDEDDNDGSNYIDDVVHENYL